MTIRGLGLVAILALVALPAAAQEAAGKWNASVDTPNGPFKMVFDLKVDGEKLTGTMTNDFAGPTPISDGMIKGNELSFKLKLEGGPNGPMTIAYKGMLKGNELMLTSTFEDGAPDGAPAEQKLTAMRAKE